MHLRKKRMWIEKLFLNKGLYDSAKLTIQLSKKKMRCLLKCKYVINVYRFGRMDFVKVILCFSKNALK